MQTFSHPDVKLKIATHVRGNYQVKEKLNKPKFVLDLKFYQNLILLLFTLCSLLIFPESPQDSEALCKKYHSIEACIIW